MTATTSDWVSTNKLLMDICDFDKSLFDTSTLSTEEIRYYNSITRGFDKQIDFFIDWLDSDEARRIFNENESYNEQVFDKIEDEIKNIVGDTSLTADEIITHIYDSGLQAGADEIRRTKYYNDATKFGLEFLQDYNFSLISNVNEDLKNHIRAEIFTGIAASESIPEVAKRILDATDNSLTGKTLSARQRAMMIARTETARAMTQGRLQSYANYGVREVKILTAGDNSVCAICREAADKIFPISEAGNLVPFHPLCRCSVTAYIRHCILPKNPIDDLDFCNLKIINSTPYKGIVFSEETSYYNFEKSKQIAEELGFKYKLNKKEGIEKFIDEKYGVEIKFDFNTLKSIDAIMKGVNYPIKYSKKEILQSYKEAPDIFKYASSIINISTKNKIVENLEKRQGGFISGTFSPENGEIAIYINSLLISPYNEGNFKLSLRHEMVHALDYHMNPNEYIGGFVGRYGLSYSLFDDEDQLAYVDCIGDDKKFQEENYPSEELVLSSHVNIDDYSEDMATAMAIVSFEYCDDISPILLVGPEGNKLTFEQWKDRYPNRYNYYYERINKLTKDDFRK